MSIRPMSRRSFGRTSVTVDVDVEIDDIVAELTDADLIGICIARGLPVLSRDDCDDALLASRMGDLSRAMLSLERALPRALAPLGALLTTIGNTGSRPC